MLLTRSLPHPGVSGEELGCHNSGRPSLWLRGFPTVQGYTVFSTDMLLPEIGKLQQPDARARCVGALYMRNRI